MYYISVYFLWAALKAGWLATQSTPPPPLDPPLVKQVFVRVIFLSYANSRELKQRQRRRTENGKKAIGLIRKTVTLHVHHAFLYIFLPSLHGYDVKLPNFTFCGGRERKTTTLFFFSWTLIQSVRIQLQKKSPNLTNWTRWKKRVKVWNRANILFKRRFGTGDTFSKGATTFFEHYNELPLSCTTFLTTLSGIVPQFTRIALKRALYFSRFMLTLSTFFHSLLAWILLRSQQSVRSLPCRHLSRKSGKTEV